MSKQVISIDAFDDPRAYLAAIVESSDDAIIAKNLNGVITSWNRAAERIFGHTAEQVVGQHITILIPEDRLKEEEEIIGRLRRGERLEHFETIRRARDGSLLNVSITVSPIRDATGTIVGASKVARDITEHKRLQAIAERQTVALEAELKRRRQVEAELRDSERTWRTLTEAMPQLVWFTRADGHCEFLSGQWAEYSGVPIEQLLGHGWLQLVHPDDRERTEQAWNEAVADRAPYDLDYRIRRADDGYRWFRARGVPLRDEDGRIIKWYGTCTDIQEVIESRDAAEQANLAKSDFLANMSHEIRTPMNAVIGLAHILAASTPLTERQKEFIRTLQLSADALLSLINDLLDIAKIEARTIELERIPFQLDQLMREVESMMAMRAREKQLEFKVSDAAIRGLTFRGDPARLRQIILNLCANAVKFTEKGGIYVDVTLTDGADAAHKNVRIAVRDTGIGIPTDKLGDIFQKFVQADASISRQYGGTGLGLTITKTLTELMGGEVRAESTRGKGSSFIITLPLPLSDSAMARNADKAGPESPSLRRHRILLVEDYAPNVLVATTVLEQFGYDCDVVATGLEAIERAKSGRYALALMDVQMHGMNGLDATRHIRAHERQQGLPPLPIIGMTAHALAGDRERCLSAGMSDYIAKPFNVDELQSKLERFTATSRVAA